MNKMIGKIFMDVVPPNLFPTITVATPNAWTFMYFELPDYTILIDKKTNIVLDVYKGNETPRFIKINAERSSAARNRRKDVPR